MAQYTVPQDVEADDKLLGPFSFRQFIYLMIIAGLIGLGVLLYKMLAPLCIIVVPPILLLGALALPLKKDQPMETYLSAVVSYHLKSHKRIWEPGQPETTIEITAPKRQEDDYTNGLSGEEASSRLSFLADIVDTEGYAIKGGSSSINPEVLAEAAATQDMFATAEKTNVDQNLQAKHEQTVEQMHQIANGQTPQYAAPQYPQAQPVAPQEPIIPAPITAQPVQTQQTPIAPTLPTPVPMPQPEQAQFGQAIQPAEQTSTQDYDIAAHSSVTILPGPAPEEAPAPEIEELANNQEYSVETIAKEANRIDEQKGSDGEVYVSLH